MIMSVSTFDRSHGTTSPESVVNLGSELERPPTGPPAEAMGASEASFGVACASSDDCDDDDRSSTGALAMVEAPSDGEAGRPGPSWRTSVR